MIISPKAAIGNIGRRIGTALFLIFLMTFAANAFQAENQNSSANTSTTNQNSSANTSTSASSKTDYIEVVGKVLSIDPIKGDASVRLEFVPHGKFANEDFTLARNVKLDINSSNGKQEITFDKGKRMTPTEAVLNMYDGSVTDYPFDKHSAQLIFYFTIKPDKPAAPPKPAEDAPAAETKPETAADEDDEIDIPFTLDFNPTLAGYDIVTEKSKDSDDNFIDIEMTITRSSMVKMFSGFVMLLMWGLSLAVLGLVITVISGRKIELAMFSFIGTLIFAFVAVRNSQSAVPPIGTFSDYASFFWAEVILALSLLTIVFIWIFKPAAK